ncbi:MAG: acetyl-CoA carboxylase biotin carboxylase subunit [Thermodesulfobacteriota bacterium]
MRCRVFERILIANRGEIARRIIKTCARLGIGTVAIYSQADARSPHVEEADDAAFIGPPVATESYLNREKIIEAAISFGCRAVHPGYGFLSENAEFARMVEQSGLAFIGPSPEAIALLGDKIASRELALKAGVPVVPGTQEPIAGVDEAIVVAEQIGFPMLLKPAAGGGGRGMRVVREKDELASALEAARDETRKGFADDRIFIERYVERPRHIEIQIMADTFGNVVYLGERECSVQRRYQKVIEETPSPAVDEPLRRHMGETACELARAAGYAGAGTVEFILDPAGNFYFLEMNTRLQVEHPVTEEVTGLDLVELQIRVAAGEPLALRQADVSLNGWAIEARICAEDPSRGSFPTTGIVTRFAMPRGTGVRVDSGIRAGSLVTIYYDSLLAKVIAHGETRIDAIRRLSKALNGCHIEGFATTVDFANAVVNHPAFVAGDLSTHFLEEHFQDGESKIPPREEDLRLLSIAVVLVYHTRQSLVRESLREASPRVGAGEEARVHHYVVNVDAHVFEVEMEADFSGGVWYGTVGEFSYKVVTPKFEYYRRRLKLNINGTSHTFRLQYEENHIRAFYCGIVRTFEVYTPREWALAHHMIRERVEVLENFLKCPMPGLVTAVSVAPGDYVRRGQELLRIESMKMETAIASFRDGEIDRVLVQPKQAVDTDEILLTFKGS